MTLLRRFAPSALPVLLCVLAASACAAALTPDLAHSSVSATFKEENVPVDASFRKFSASIDYDAAHPAAARASVTIDTASLDLGMPDMNGEVAKKEWFDSARFPQASFTSTAIRPGAPGQLQVTGKLTIKGRTAAVSFPLKVSSTGAQTVFDGQLPIRRLAFNVGEGEWKDTSAVADEVIIKFHIVARH
jgi:polyisoprenoid-binding protein YceI